MSGILDEANRKQAIAINPAASVWVSASAGTGKTKVLTDRVLALLLAGTPPHRILCLTFTKAAAAEMSNRLLEILSKWTIADEPKLLADLTPLLPTPPNSQHVQTARQLFARVLDVPGGMHIETIHAFCQSLLRRFPIEAGLSPHFQVMDDTDAVEILGEIQTQVLASAQAQSSSHLAAALKAVTDRIHETRFAELMEALTKNRGQIARMLHHHGGVDGAIAALSQRLGIAAELTAEAVLDQACDESQFDAAGLRHAVTIMLNGKISDQKAATAMEMWLANPLTRFDQFDAYCLAYLTQDGEPRKKLPTLDLVRKHPQLIETFSQEAQRLILVQNQIKAITTRDATRALLTLGQALLTAYEQRKQILSTLDYDDLIIRSRNLLERSGISPWVLFKLDGGIDHVLIDEAQDTNPDQWAVVRALTLEFFAGHGARADARTIFAVGDAKQSIYSFQRADPAEFAAMRRYFGQKVLDANQKWEDVDLLVSFRSTPAVLQAVNAVFAPGAPARLGVAADDEDITHLAARAGQGGTVELWPPVAVRPLDPPTAWKPPIERIRADSPSQRLAGLMAERIGAMVGRDILSSRGRPIRAGDIMVLVRRRGPFVEDLIRALKSRSIAVAGADRMILTEQIAVMDLLALGACLLQPHDDLCLATVLKGPLVGLSEDQLFDLAHGRTGTLWDTLRRHAETLAPMEKAWTRLTRWQALADALTPFEFYSALLGAEGGRTRLAARLGAEADDPLDEFLTLALVFQRSHPPSLQTFLHWLGTIGIEIKRDMEQGTVDAVRIMTVHGSKGLQAPIVLLPDTMQPPKSSTDPLYWLDDTLVAWPTRASQMDPVCLATKSARDESHLREYHRLLYVAATRAEDRLIICGWSGRNSTTNAWYHTVQSALSTIAATREDAVLQSRQETETALLWHLDTPQTAKPDRQHSATAKDQQRLEGSKPWAFQAPPTEPSPPRPLAPSRPTGDEPVVRSPLAQKDGTAIFKRGTLIHRLLQMVPNLDPTQWSAAIQRFLAHAAPDWDARQRVTLASEVLDVLTHPDFKTLFGPGSLAEIPVAGLVGTRAIAGVVDRLVVTETQVLIIDFKTNRRPPVGEEAIPPHYIQQMAAYRLALACIYPHHKVRCVLLWTDGPSMIELNAKVMDDVLSQGL